MISQSNRPRLPMWLIGVAIAGLLIFLSVRDDPQPGNRQLSEMFAAQPTPAIALPAPEIALTDLPPELQRAADGLWQRLNLGQQVTPVEPVVRGARIEVIIESVVRRGEQVQVAGRVTNLSQAPVAVPISAFELRDSFGIAYSADGNGQATLAPGESTPLDLSLPLPLGRGLLLVTRLAPDPVMTQILLAEES